METGEIRDGTIGKATDAPRRGTPAPAPWPAPLPGGCSLSNSNAPHATLPVRPTDRAVRAGCRALAGLWWLLGLRRASGVLRHYLSGTGAPYVLDVTTLAALPPVRAAVNARLMAAETGVWSGTDDWRDIHIAPSTSLDWWLAVDAIQYRVVRPNPRYYRVEFRKTWNPDRGEPGYGIPFARLARLHETGAAREFTATGRTGYLPR
ncbi:hypothetical protein ACQPZG_23400 [Streptomyces sp. CA-294286]|uniref:hypothetical protein n=1 Tax=Streptomyces sp. CA-294286 TaxID=3240070 RepID=UPI003D8B2021